LQKSGKEDEWEDMFRSSIDRPLGAANVSMSPILYSQFMFVHRFGSDGLEVQQVT